MLTRHVGMYLYSFVTHGFSFFLCLGFEVQLVLPLATSSLMCFSEVSEKRFFIFPSAVHHFYLSLIQPLDMNKSLVYVRYCSGFTFSSQDLSNCTIVDVVKPTDRAVRTDCSLLPPHKTDNALISSSLKAFLEILRSRNFLKFCCVSLVKSQVAIHVCVLKLSGRPKNRLEDNIKQDICQMKIKNWTACVQDREKWKKEVVEKAKTFGN